MPNRRNNYYNNYDESNSKHKLDYLHNKHYKELKEKGVRFDPLNNNGYSYFITFFDNDYFDFLSNNITVVKKYVEKHRNGEYSPDSLPNESTFDLNSHELINGIKDDNGTLNLESQKILNFSHEVICGALNLYNDERWNLVADEVNSSTNNAGHNCGLGGYHSSLDSDQVEYLDNLLNDVRNVFLPQSQKFVNDYNNSFFANFIKNYLARKIQYYQSRVQPLIEYYNNVIADLNNEISILRNILNDATANNNILSDNSKTLDNNLEMNNDYTNYLKERINIPKSVSINNYEELYKGVILQNDILQNSIDDIDNKVLLDDKKTNFIIEKRSFVNSIYLKLFLFYYILVIIFIIFLIFIERNSKYYNKILFVILAILFPPIMFYIETILYNIWLYIISFLSSSVYTYTDLSQ